MLGWTHSGFSVDLTLKIPASSSKAREALAQYLARPPVSLQKMLLEEHAGSLLYRSEYNPHFHTDSMLFPATEFLLKVLQHLPDAGTPLILAMGCIPPAPVVHGPARPTLPAWLPRAGRRTTRGTACSAPQHTLPAHHGSVRVGQGSPLRLGKAARKDLRGRSLALYPLRFPDAGPCRHYRPQQVLRILRHLIKTGAAPPGLDAASLS